MSVQPLSVGDVGQTKGKRRNTVTPVRVTQEEEERRRDTYDDGDVISGIQEGETLRHEDRGRST